MPAGPAAAPDLGDHAAVCHGCAAGQALTLDQGHDVAVTALDGHKGPGVQHQHQAAPRPRSAGLYSSGLARTMMARSRARRVASRISSSVISPCSAS